MLDVTIYNSIINLITADVFAKVLPWNILPRFLIGARRLWLNSMFSFGLLWSLTEPTILRAQPKKAISFIRHIILVLVSAAFISWYTYFRSFLV